MHTQGSGNLLASGSVPNGNSLPSAEALALISSTKCSRVKVVKHQDTRSYAGKYYTFVRREACRSIL